MFSIAGKLIFTLLIVTVLVSAIQLIVVRHQNRLLFIELQNFQQQRDTLDIRWGQLKLEQSTWAQQSRVEAIAREQLGMILPTADKIIIVKP